LTNFIKTKTSKEILFGRKVSFKLEFFAILAYYFISMFLETIWALCLCAEGACVAKGGSVLFSKLSIYCFSSQPLSYFKVFHKPTSFTKKGLQPNPIYQVTEKHDSTISAWRSHYSPSFCFVAFE
jgi:hypothetical protein